MVFLSYCISMVLEFSNDLLKMPVSWSVQAIKRKFKLRANDSMLTLKVIDLGLDRDE